MSIFKKKYPKNKENKNDYEDVYAGPEEMSRRPLKPFTQVLPLTKGSSNAFTRVPE